MAEKPAKKDETPAPAEQPAPKKGGMSLKTIMIMAVVLVIEGVAISAAFMLSGKPAEVHADPAAHSEAAEMDKPVEILVVEDKFQNTRSGKTYLYDTQIYIVVKAKDEEGINAKLEVMSAQIAADIGTIFRRAEPAQLLEPTLATLTRQIKAVMDDRLGLDQDHKSRIQEVLLKKYTQYRVDM
jgi:flagellar basal body-associated protein FliL